MILPLKNGLHNRWLNSVNGKKMSKKMAAQVRSQYTREFKLEAIRLVKGGQGAMATRKPG